MTRIKNARRIASGVIAAAVLPVAAIATASTASAHTTSGCTINPLKPVYSHTNASGVKVLDYRITVSCQSGRHAHITQRRYEADPWINPDDHVGTTNFTTSGVRTLHNYRTLVNTEPGKEEMYQKIRFRVHSSNGVMSAWTGWHNSGTRSFFN